MNKYDAQPFVLVEKQEIAKNIFDFKLENHELAPMAKPGQFVHIAIPGKILRRPISVCDACGDVIRIVFRIKGEGTEVLSQADVGEKLNLIAPLGNGFVLDKDRTYAFVGGGIGVPPLLFAARQVKRSFAVLGFANSDSIILRNDFESACCQTVITTDDGSFGFHGLVTDALKSVISKVDEVCACGPTPMLRAVAMLCMENHIPCQVSLEERMGCGIGACLVCACKTQHNGEENYSHVCKDGPVFNAEEVVWNG